MLLGLLVGLDPWVLQDLMGPVGTGDSKADVGFRDHLVLMGNRVFQGTLDSLDPLASHHSLGASWSLRWPQVSMRNQHWLGWCLLPGGKQDQEDIQDPPELQVHLEHRGYQERQENLGQWDLMDTEDLRVLQGNQDRTVRQATQEKKESWDSLGLRAPEAFPACPAIQA